VGEDAQVAPPSVEVTMFLEAPLVVCIIVPEGDTLPPQFLAVLLIPALVM